MSPAQRHREDTFRRHADEYERVSCYFAEEGGCRGRLQAAHIISAQTLKRMHSEARLACDQVETGFRSRIPEWQGNMGAVESLDDLLADGRNGVPACERHHHLHEGPILHCHAPEAFYEFVADYGLEHVVENARTAA